MSTHPGSIHSTNSESPTPTIGSRESQRVSEIARRIHGWSWQAFPVGMGTGAVYLTLSGLKQRPHGLVIVELIFYFLNMFLFCMNSITLLLQAILYPRQAWRTVTHPSKGIFVPLFTLSFATLIIGTINYAVPPGIIHSGFIYVLFWVYLSMAVITCFIMMFIWFSHPHDLSLFTPAYAFLIFPMMLTGVVAYNVLKVMDPNDPRSLGILLIGYCFQGLGFFLTFFYICIYITRLIMTGFLEGQQASGAFVACGPPGFTAMALIELGENAKVILTQRNFIGESAGEIWYAVGVMSAVMLFGLAIFFFIFAALPYGFKVRRDLRDVLSCWALTFPNVGWIACIRLLGDIFDIKGFHVLHIITACAMCITWLVLFILTIVAFVKGDIFKSRDEDVARDIWLSAHRNHSVEKV